MKSKEDILFVLSKKSVSYPILKSKGCWLIEPYKQRSRWAYKYRYVANLLKIDGGYGLFSELSDELLHANPKKIVIEGTVVFEPFIKKLRERFPKEDILFFYSNIIKDPASVHPSVLNKYDVKAYSWDKADCDSYGLAYCKPSFDVSIMPQLSEINYDVCFIGADKGRYKIIRDLRAIFDKYHFKSYIRVTPDFKFLKRLHSYYSDSIPYDEYLRVVSSSKCIIDLVQKGQIGTTMRVMEALFSGKKLISNNVHLAEYDFYHPDNIFILGKDDDRDIYGFLMKDYKPIDRKILYEYTTDYWLNNILNIND